jgi:site-specific DNA recombinase
VPAATWKPIRETEQRLARLTRSDTLAGLVGNGQQLRGAWDGLNLTRHAAIVRAVIGLGVLGARTLDPDRVQPVWRL